MQTVIGIIIALIIFSILIVIHEFGHFLLAKKNKVTVNEFSVGMGPRIISHQAKSGTRYSLKLLPLGGSCAMLGEDEDNEEEGSFNSKSVWARIVIVIAGPVFNFILAFILSFIVIGFSGTDLSYVTSLETNSPAYEAGLREGDRIVSFNGSSATLGRELYLDMYADPIDENDIKLSYIRDGKKYRITYSPQQEARYLVGMSYATGSSPAELSSVTSGSAMDEAGAKSGDTVVAMNGTEISTGDELEEYINDHPFDGSDVEITLLRNKKELNVTVTPQMTQTYSCGFVYNLAREKQSVLNVAKYSLVEMRYEISTVLKSLRMLVTGKVSAGELSGPVGIVDMIGDTYNEARTIGISTTILSLINLSIMLSANLGVMNLLPIPALDGGRILFCIVEIITRRKIPKDKEGMIHFVGFVILMILMVLLFFNDIRKIFF